MRAGGDFGDNPAIRPVRLVLRGNALRKNHALTGDQRRRRLVARALYAENNLHPIFHL